MRKSTDWVTKKQIKDCKFCGAPIVWRNYKSTNAYYPADVYFDSKQETYFVVTGMGAHFNFQPRHKCTDKCEATQKAVIPENISTVTEEEIQRGEVLAAKIKGYTERYLAETNEDTKDSLNTLITERMSELTLIRSKMKNEDAVKLLHKCLPEIYQKNF